MEMTLIESALQGATMEAVIALTERIQTLENHPTGCIFTAYRVMDETLTLGYSEDLSEAYQRLGERGYKILASRRGTRREQRLVLITLKEIGLTSSIIENCFKADALLLKYLNHLGWPVGELNEKSKAKSSRKRFTRKD